MKNPGTILKLWNKAVKKHEEGKKPDDLAKKGQEQKQKIKFGLTQLKLQGAAEMANPAAREKFVAMRDRVTNLLTKYCRYLKNAKDEDKKALPKYLKTVKALTVTVQKLNPGDLDQKEEDAGLEALDAVDVTSLDKTLEQPDTGEDEDLDESESEEEENEEEGEEKTGSAPVDEATAKVRERLKGLSDAVKAAVAAKGSNASRIGALFQAATGLLNNGDAVQAGKVLDELEPLVRAAPADDFNARLKALLPRVLEGQKANPAIATDLKLGISEAQVFGRKKDFAQANAILDRVEKLLGQGASTGEAGDDELREEFLKTKSALYPAVTKAAAASPDHKDQLIRLLGLAGKHEKAKEWQEGLGILADLSEAIDAAMAGAGPEEAPLPEVKDLAADGLDVWRAAQERVGAQISNLQKFLRKTGDPDLVKIADFGLNGITGRLQVGLQAALFDFTRSAPPARPEAAAKVGGLIGEYEKFLQGNPEIKLCDKNPFGVKVSIQATLAAALNQLKKALPKQGA